MSDTNFLSVAEFAEAAGVSVQAVYKRLKRDLAPFTDIRDNRTVISVAALELFNGSKPLNTEKPGESKPDKETVAFLMTQLAEKDKLIAQQQAMISSQAEEIQGLHSHIIEQSVAQTEILRKQAQLQENFQILLAQNQKLMLGGSTVESVEQPVEQPVVKPQPSEAPAQPSTSEPEPKKGFWARLLGR